MGEFSYFFIMETTIKYTAHLTENHQLKAADQLISKLRQQLSANEEYIKEIEEENQIIKEKTEKPLLEKIEELTLALTKEKAAREKLCQKYSDDVQQFIKTDILYAKYKKELDELKEENKRLKHQKEDLIYRILKLENV